MIRMKKDKKEYDIAEHRVEKLLKRGYTLVQDTPESEVVNIDHEDQKHDGENE